MLTRSKSNVRKKCSSLINQIEIADESLQENKKKRSLVKIAGYEKSSNEEESKGEGEKQKKPSPKKQRMTRSKTRGRIPPRTSFPSVGARHQVEIQALPTSRDIKQPQRSSHCWNPNNPLNDEEINKYLQDATRLLKSHAERITSNSLVPVPASPMLCDAEFKPINNRRTAASVMPLLLRESNMDQIYATLHNHGYDISKALLYIKSNPAEHVVAHTRSQQRLHHSAYHEYAGNLRVIVRNLKSNELKSKSIIDYYYRFQVPKEFRKFQEQGNEEASALTRSKKKALRDSLNASPPANEKKVKARDFLVEIRDLIGDENFNILGERLSTYHTMCAKHGDKTFKDAADSLKIAVFPLFDGNMELYSRFVEFLPKRFR